MTYWHIHSRGQVKTTPSARKAQRNAGYCTQILVISSSQRSLLFQPSKIKPNIAVFCLYSYSTSTLAPRLIHHLHSYKSCIHEADTLLAVQYLRWRRRPHGLSAAVFVKRISPFRIIRYTTTWENYALFSNKLQKFSLQRSNDSARQQL